MSLSYTHSILIAAIYQRPCDDLHHHRVILPTRVVTKHPTPRCHPPSWCQFSKTYHWQHLIVRIRFFNLFWQRSEIYALFSGTYDSLSDVPESRVCFASKNLTPCRMHWNAFLIAQIIAKCHRFRGLGNSGNARKKTFFFALTPSLTG